MSGSPRGAGPTVPRAAGQSRSRYRHHARDHLQLGNNRKAWFPLVGAWDHYRSMEEGGASRTHEFSVPLDHAQFFVEDVTASEVVGGWDVEATYRALERDHLAVKPRGLVVATARWHGDARVAVEVHDRAPAPPLEEWDHAAEAALDAPGGAVVVYAPEQTGGADVPRLPLRPGRYRALVLYGGLESVEDELGPAGEDHYRILLWPSAAGGGAGSDTGAVVRKRGFWCCLQGHHA